MDKDKRISALERELDSLKSGTIKTMKMCECGRHYHLPSDKCCDKCLIAELEAKVKRLSSRGIEDMQFTIAELETENAKQAEAVDGWIHSVADLQFSLKNLNAQLAEHESNSDAMLEVLSQGGISVVGCLETMANWIDHLMNEHNCDHHGYEVACHARDLGREHIKSIEEVKAKVLHLPEAKPEAKKPYYETFKDLIEDIKPASFLPECKWQHQLEKEGVSVTYCHRSSFHNCGKPCSKRCESPEPAVDAEREVE